MRFLILLTLSTVSGFNETQLLGKMNAANSVDELCVVLEQLQSELHLPMRLALKSPSEFEVLFWQRIFESSQVPPSRRHSQLVNLFNKLRDFATAYARQLPVMTEEYFRHPSFQVADDTRDNEVFNVKINPINYWQRHDKFLSSWHYTTCKCHCHVEPLYEHIMHILFLNRRLYH